MRVSEPGDTIELSQLDLLTITEVCKLTRLSKTSIRTEIAAGRLPVLRIGRSVRLRRADFSAWIEGWARDAA